ncbi:hypothetical protein [Ktedonobacter racemifer]|uniref:hypothetical protein n=1 Tax=Ktedonobacter racemifer TaxID=363277 RepID=UPI00058E89FC|nr:hypothetical protein [Ktedonobacter racemifer]
MNSACNGSAILRDDEQVYGVLINLAFLSGERNRERVGVWGDFIPEWMFEPGAGFSNAFLIREGLDEYETCR